MATNYPSRVLDQVRSKVAGISLEQSKTVGGDQTATDKSGNDAALWTIGPGGATISSTLREVDTFDQKDYVKKLEESVQWMEEKMAKVSKEIKKLK